MRTISTDKAEIILIDFPSNEKRRYYGVFCKDEDVKCKIVTLMGESFANIYQESTMTGTHYPHGGVIYNVKITTGFTHLFKLSEATNEDALMVVDSFEEPKGWTNYVDYVDGGKEVKGDGTRGIVIGFSDPLLSLKSFITRHSLPIDAWVVVKINSNR